MEWIEEVTTRRTNAMRLSRPCHVCHTDQVQLVDWTGDNSRWRCRHCKQEWDIPIPSHPDKE